LTRTTNEVPLMIRSSGVSKTGASGWMAVPVESEVIVRGV
jgi:hypothetical protein